MKFAISIVVKKISGRSIMFTDEKRFLLKKQTNKQTNRIRLSKENVRKLKEGDPYITAKMQEPIKLHEEGFMLLGDVLELCVNTQFMC